MPTRATKVDKLKRDQQSTDESDDSESEELNESGFRTLATHLKATIYKLPHCVLPSLNVGEFVPIDPEHLRLNLKCEMKTPRALYVTDTNVQLNDICTSRPMAKEFYKRYVARSSGYYTAYSKRNKKIKALEEKNVYSTVLFAAIEGLHKDPDPFFHGNCDFYYTRGNIAVIEVSEEKQLLHATGSTVENLNLSKLYPPETSIKPYISKTSDTPNEIFQVLPLTEFAAENPHVFAMRHRNKITINSIAFDGGDYIDKDNCRMPVCIEFKSQMPFISVAQSKLSPTTLLISDMEQRLRQYEITAEAPRLIEKYYASKYKDISWNMLEPWHDGTFFYVNRTHISCLDLRTATSEWEREQCSRGSNVMHCDNISVLASSQAHPNRLYVGTSHKLYCLDARKLGDSLDDTEIIACWTHQLQYPPLFASVFCLNDCNYEYVALASSSADDMVLCEVSPANDMHDFVGSTDAYTSYVLPYQPPTLQEAYEAAILKGECLNSGKSFKYRLTSCTTGLAFYSANETDSYLLSTNSLGDVFARAVQPCSASISQARVDDYSIRMIVDYEAEVQSKICMPQPYTAIFKLPELRQELKPRVVTVEQIETEQNSQIEAPIGIPNDAPLDQYKGALDQTLLSVWNCLDDDQVSTKDLDAVLPATPKANTVQDWLEEILRTQNTTNTPEDDTVDLGETKNDTTLLTEASLPMYDESTIDYMQLSQPRPISAIKKKKAQSKGF